MTLRKKNQRKKQVPNTDDEIIESRPVVRKKVVMPCRPCNIVMPAEKRKSAPSLIIQPARTQQSTSVATTEQVKRKDPPTSLVQPLFLFQTLFYCATLIFPRLKQVLYPYQKKKKKYKKKKQKKTFFPF